MYFNYGVGKGTGKALRAGGDRVRTRAASYGAVRRRITEVLEKHPELWREGRLVENEVTIGLPEAAWVFIDRFAKMTQQTRGEVIAHFAQEFLGMTIASAQRHIKVEES